MGYTKEKLEKLPKWAQYEIKRLEGYTKTLEQRISEMSGESETNTYLVDGLSKMPLPKNAQIEFQTGKNNLNKVSVYVRIDGTIDLNAYSLSMLDVAILPRSANAFYITFIER